MTKKPGDEFFEYDDGLVIQFPVAKPKHLSFHCKTDDALSESCDVKLFKLDQNDENFDAANGRRLVELR